MKTGSTSRGWLAVPDGAVGLSTVYGNRFWRAEHEHVNFSHMSNVWPPQWSWAGYVKSNKKVGHRIKDGQC